MSWKYLNRSKISRERACHLLRRPHVTEKATMGAERNEAVFQVSKDASKPEIKAAVEMLFEVKVEGVNVIRQKGKVKRFRGRKGVRNETKKAIVKLVEGQTIDTGLGG